MFSCCNNLDEKYDIREAATLVPGTIIFPQIATAFNIADLRTWFARLDGLPVIAENEGRRKKIVEQVKEFTNRYRQRAFVIFYCPMFSECDLQAVSEIQERAGCRCNALFATTLEEIKNLLDAQHEVISAARSIKEQIRQKISKCSTVDAPESFRYDPKTDGPLSQNALTAAEEEELEAIVANCCFN